MGTVRVFRTCALPQGLHLAPPLNREMRRASSQEGSGPKDSAGRMRKRPVAESVHRQPSHRHASGEAWRMRP